MATNQLEIIVHIPSKSTSLEQCATAIAAHTTAEYRITVILDGATKTDEMKAHSIMQAGTGLYRVIRNRQPLGQTESIKELVMTSDTLSDYILIMGSNVELRDNSWFPKMQIPILKDPQCAVVLAQTFGSSTMPATKLPPKSTVSADIALLRGSAAKGIMEEADTATGFNEAIHSQTRRMGNTRWLHQGINYRLIVTCEPLDETDLFV